VLRGIVGPGLLSGLRSDCKWPVEHTALSGGARREHHTLAV